MPTVILENRFTNLRVHMEQEAWENVDPMHKQVFRQVQVVEVPEEVLALEKQQGPYKDGKLQYF